jgi:hypothetical protein
MNALLTKTIAEPLLAGAAGALINSVLQTGDVVPTILGTYSPSLVVFGTVTASSALAEVVNNYALQKFTYLQSLGRFAKPAFTGAATMIVSSVLQQDFTPDSSKATAFLVGATAEFAGSFAYTNLAPLIQIPGSRIQTN